MKGVPRLMFHGLAEGLILAAVEQQPASATALRERLGRQLGQTPPRDAVEPLLEELAAGDRVRAKGEEGESEPTYHLTQEGARRLAAYRRLPAALAEAFEHLVSAGGEPSTNPGTGAAPEPASVSPEDAGSWVEAALDRLPQGPPVRDPHAEVRLDRDTASGRWSLEVRGHTPGRCQDEGACPLSFLYRAAVALLYHREAAQTVDPESHAPR